jgi:PKD repeat protein
MIYAGRMVARRRFRLGFWPGLAGGGAPARRFATLGIVGAAASLVLAVGVSEAKAAVVIGAAPTRPISADAPVGPPPIPALPAAGATPPPADQIADPVTPSASCGGWYQSTNYADTYSAASTWWEYQCASPSTFTSCSSGACDPLCPSFDAERSDQVDLFYWDGSNAVFYGEGFSYACYYNTVGDEPPPTNSAWWDMPTQRWYNLGPFGLTVSSQGSGSGRVGSTPVGIDCGDSCASGFFAGTVVTLTATPDAGSLFSGWSGDCSGTGGCQVTMDQARSVTATFAQTTVELTVSRAGTGSGQVSSSPAGISCGDGCQASFDAGTVVTLTATADSSSVFTGWSGDCSGAGACQVTMDQARSVTATFASNSPPHASFTVACTGLRCGFDASGSFDSDGTIATYAWDFGDGTSAGGRTTSHTYARAGIFTATLTLTDNTGATATQSRTVTPISLTARGYKLNGLERVDLSWSGPSGASFDIYRNSTNLTSVQANAYTDTLAKKGSGTYTYTVCAAAFSSCSALIRSRSASDANSAWICPLTRARAAAATQRRRPTNEHQEADRPSGGAVRGRRACAGVHVAAGGCRRCEHNRLGGRGRWWRSASNGRRRAQRLEDRVHHALRSLPPPRRLCLERRTPGGRDLDHERERRPT